MQNLFRLSYKNDGFRQIHAGGNGRSFFNSIKIIYYLKRDFFRYKYGDKWYNNYININDYIN